MSQGMEHESLEKGTQMLNFIAGLPKRPAAFSNVVFSLGL